jgi:hypothetical protein
MPVSKTRKSSHARRREGVVTNRMALAGARPAFRALESILSTWHSADGPQADTQDIVGLQGFFLGYDRVCKNAGVPYDPTRADDILGRMHRNDPVSIHDMMDLRNEAHALLRLATKVRSPKIWKESLDDMDIYCHVHGWEWKGIGNRETPVGFSADATKIAA